MQQKLMLFFEKSAGREPSETKNGTRNDTFSWLVEAEGNEVLDAAG